MILLYLFLVKSFLEPGKTSLPGDQILPFLGIVLVLSFIKQVYNYLFVALEKQNLLFEINLVGVLIGAGVGVRLIPTYGLM